MGGLSKKAYQLESMRKSGDKPLVALDAGALLFPQERLAAGNAEELKATAMGIVEAYNVMGFAAAGVAPQDLAGGLAFLQTVKDKAAFPLLSANLVDAKDGNPLFTTSTVIKAGNLAVGVIGLTGEKVPADNLEGKAAILPWQEALPAVAADLAGRADLVVLLSSYPLEENKKIGAMLPQIHLILQAGTTSKTLAPLLTDNILITQTELKGKYVGVLDLLWQNSKKWGSDPADELSETRSEEDRIRWQLKRYQGKGEPEVVYRDNEKILTAYKSLVQKHEGLLARIAALEEAMKKKQADGSAVSTFKHRFIAMETSLPGAPRVEEIVLATNEKVNAIGKKKAKHPERKTAGPPAPALADYQGWEACVSCHPEQSRAWQETRHARAYRTLEEKGQQFNFKCVRCHVTGLFTEESPEMALPQGLLAVGCESCHGPGREHLQDPEERMAVLPTAEICQGCHSSDQDDDFDYERDRLLAH